ncbi:sigma-54 dependent transcriptional regulator [bacterium]|nr:sigma-54 dependent transcriptional regulator [bacterium]
MATSKIRLLFIDDDKNFRKVTAFALREAGYEVTTAANGQEGLEALAANRPDVVLCDVKMPVMDGIEFLAAVKERIQDPPPVIVVTAFGSIENAVDAMTAGASDYVTKPVNRDALRFAIERVTESSRLRRENRLLREKVGGRPTADRMIGTSPAIKKLRETLQRLAESEATVLLRGESGVGKELAARALHFDGPRSASGQFVVLNCAAIPGELLESELFGHRKGSFTGAVVDHTGKFEAAHNGTLFLDEIGDMPMALQAKLLRALQEGEVTPIGENKARRVDVRVVAATNQPLEARVEEGAFRQDLYYRLAVVPVELPPLRARRDDLPMLVKHFLARYGAPGAGISDDAMEEMKAHNWPGNIRELENVIARACALRPGLETLEASDLAIGRGPKAPGQSNLLAGGGIEIPDEGVEFEEIERQLLEAAWEKSQHNQKKGAELLNLPRQAFIYRLQKYGIIPQYGDKTKAEAR